MSTDTASGSEYGGVPGLIQPDPHVPTPAEVRMQMMFSDPMDADSDGSEVISGGVDNRASKTA